MTHPPSSPGSLDESPQLLEAGTNTVVTFTDFTTTPLGYRDLVNATPDGEGTIRIPLRLSKARAESADKSFGEDLYDVRFELSTKLRAGVYALLPGGWIPAGMLPDNALVLLDRCTISRIRGHYRAGIKDERFPPDFLDFLAQRRLRISPLPFMAELSEQRRPTLGELGPAFDEICEIIAQAFPSAVVFPDRGSVIRGLGGLIEEDSATHAREIAFVRDVAPLIATPTREELKARRWEKILDLAQTHNVRPGSLPCLAALSALVAHQGSNPARRLFKVGQGFGAKEAFNVVSDLFALRLMMAANGDFPHDPPAFVTEDRPLAMFWTGLGVKQVSRLGQQMTAVVNPSSELYPGEFRSRLMSIQDGEVTGPARAAEGLRSNRSGCE